MALVIITAAKEEVRRSGINSEKSVQVLEITDEVKLHI